MSHILCLRLSGPMQSWGVMSRFSRRDTGKEPSKSGVIGLLCAAMGISRDEANSENPVFQSLSSLMMGVRVLREGVMQSDYHTAQNIAKADGKGIKETELSTRFYLADADFVVALNSDDRELLDSAQTALKHPKWQLFLGRKAFVPDLPVYFIEGVFKTDDTIEKFLQSGSLAKILAKYQEHFGARRAARDGRQRLVIEDENGAETRQDVPLSFAARRFTNRRVRTTFVNINNGGERDGDLFNEDGVEHTLAGGLE